MASTLCLKGVLLVEPEYSQQEEAEVVVDHGIHPAGQDYDQRLNIGMRCCFSIQHPMFDCSHHDDIDLARERRLRAGKSMFFLERYPKM